MSKKSKDLIPPGLAFLADNIKTKNNVLGEPKAAGVKWAKDLNLPRQGETVFFAGCGYQFTKKLESLMGLVRGMDKSAAGAELPMALAGVTKKLGINVAGIYGKIAGRGADAEAQPLIDAVNSLRALGVELAYLAEDEPCCGGLLHYIGLEQDFAKHAGEVYWKLKAKGVKKVIGIVPSCTYALRDLVRLHVPDADIKVRHFSEVVLDRMSGRELRFPQEMKVTYHDPCQMARFLGLTEAPRQVLAGIKGITLVEPEWVSRQWSTCCGGGGGFEAVFPELSHVLAVNRAQELADTGAQAIVTSCPGCIMQLRGGLKELGKEEIEVLDLAQVVAASLGV